MTGSREEKEWICNFSYLFDLRGEGLAFIAIGLRATRDLADKLLQFLLGENALALAFEDIAGMFLDRGLADGTGNMRPIRHGRTRLAHGYWLGRWDVEVFWNGHFRMISGQWLLLLLLLMLMLLLLLRFTVGVVRVNIVRCWMTMLRC